MTVIMIQINNDSNATTERSQSDINTMNINI